MARASARHYAWLLFALVLAAAPVIARPEAPQPAITPRGPSLGTTSMLLQQKLNSEKYAEGLKIAEEGLLRFPESADLAYGRALCLMGLFRYDEAAAALAPLAAAHTERPDFKLELGEAQSCEGDQEAALKTWEPLFTDPAVAERAYSTSVQVLVALGREDEARKLIDEGIAMFPTGGAELMRFKLDLARKASSGVPLLERLLVLDPQNASTYEALMPLYRAGGDRPLYEATWPPSGETEIPLERTSNPRPGGSIELNITMGGSTTTSSFSSPVLTANVSFNDSPPEKTMLDSGSPVVFLSPSLAASLALKPLSLIKYRGLGNAGVLESSWVLLESLQAGPVTFHQVPAIISSSETGVWGDFSAIIPLSLFKHKALLYDPSGPSLKIMASGTDPRKAAGEGGSELQTAWFKGCPFIVGSVQALPRVFCLLDTGTFSTFLIPEVVPGLYGRPDSLDLRSMRKSTGASGDFEPMVARQIRLCLGDRCTVLAMVRVSPLPMRYGVPCAGIIGRNILDQYLVFLDYDSNRAYFKRREK